MSPSDAASPRCIDLARALLLDDECAVFADEDLTEIHGAGGFAFLTRVIGQRAVAIAEHVSTRGFHGAARSAPTRKVDDEHSVAADQHRIAV